MNFRRKPAITRPQMPPANKTLYCGKCGKPGNLICAPCAEAYKAWVEKNTQRDGKDE